MQFLVQLLSLLFLFLVLPDSFLATGRPHARKDVCHSPSVRVSWDQLDPAEKSSWTAAVKCLQTKPSVINIPGSKTLFDDFTVVHVFESGNIHFTAALVVWHAYFVHVREKHLKQCGYAGRTFFWNWMTPADGDDPWSDSIFDAETGLGGNGYKDTSRGMSSGPFMNFTVSKWAHRNKLFHRPHLVFSKWDQEKDEDDTKGRQAHKDSTGMAHWRNSKSVTKLLSSPDFNKFRTEINKAHSSVHMGIGGDLSPNSSPQSPFFFPHHVFVDCIYRHWQSLGKDKRVKDYYGNLGDADEDDGPFKASLSDPLRMHGLDVDVTVADVMNAQGDILCYKCQTSDLFDKLMP